MAKPLPVTTGVKPGSLCYQLRDRSNEAERLQAVARAQTQSGRTRRTNDARQDLAKVGTDGRVYAHLIYHFVTDILQRVADAGGHEHTYVIGRGNEGTRPYRVAEAATNELCQLLKRQGLRVRIIEEVVTHSPTDWDVRNLSIHISWR